MLLSDRMRMTYRLLLTVLALLLTGKSVLAQDDSVWVIPVEGEINSATAQYISSRIADANEERPLALLFHIDTPGGLVSAMEDIVDARSEERRVGKQGRQMANGDALTQTYREHT